MHSHRPTGRSAKSAGLGLLLGCLVLLIGRTLPAQQGQPAPGFPTPRLTVVLPTGGRIGTTVEVTLTGVDLDGTQRLLFSHPGLSAEPIAPPAPPPADPKKPAPPRTPAAPRFKVHIAADVPVGSHDVRVVNKWGISNPRPFVVGDLAELLEQEPNNDVPQAQRVPLNSIVSGTIASPTDVDYFVFAGQKGQRVIVSCLASSIDSRLRAAVDLYDRTGRQLAFNRHYKSNDALLDCTLPEDGDYYVRLYEFTHTQGSPEHYYRLTITTAPWIDAVSPVVVEPGKTTPLTVFGRNLPNGQLDPTAVQDGSVLEKAMVMVDVPSDPAALQRLALHSWVPPQAAALDGFELRLHNGAGTSNPFLLTYARAPVVLSNEANHSPATAQLVALPCEISGQFVRRRVRDWYTFPARKGEVYSIEVLSDRLGAPNDMHFALRRLENKQEVANLDDDPEVLAPIAFYNRTEDPPVYRFAIPADGQYQLMVASHGIDSQAGMRHFYRVRITPERPDFHLIVMPADGHSPSSCCLRPGGDEAFTILVWRREGFSGPITLTMEGLPTRVSCPPQVLGPNLKEAALVVSAGLNAPEWTGEVKVKGTAIVNGQTVVREARPASITWPVTQPQGIPAISRLDRNLVLAVRDKAPFSLTASVEQTTVLAGSKIPLTLKLARLQPDFKAAVSVVPIDPATHLPKGLTVGNNNQPVSIAADKEDAPPTMLEVKTSVPPGTYNLVLRGSAAVPFRKDAMAKQKTNLTVALPSNPITLTVLPNQVAKLALSNANPTLKIGAETELVVKVTRLHDYAGAYQVRLAPTDALKGVSAADVTIPAGMDEGKLRLRAAADAAPGKRTNVVIQALATLDGRIPVPHEIKFTVNVVK